MANVEELSSLPGAQAGGETMPGRLPRRRFLQAATLGSLATMAGAPARAAGEAPVCVNLEASSASPELTAFMTDFFDAKTRRDVDATMEFFSPDLVTYTDATLGWDLAGKDALRGIFTEYMPRWPDTARSYATRLVGDMRGGAFVAFTDTPELFGGELRLLASIDFRDGKIVRWIDHWDSRGWPNSYGLEKSSLTDLREGEIDVSATPKMREVAERLFAWFGDGASDDGSGLFAYDVVFEDMALRSQLQGREAVGAYLKRAFASLPYGKDAVSRHVTGWDKGGAIEWANAKGPVRYGVTGVVLDDEGTNVRLTTVYDGGLIENAQVASMAMAVLNV